MRELDKLSWGRGEQAEETARAKVLGQRLLVCLSTETSGLQRARGPGGAGTEECGASSCPALGHGGDCGLYCV